MISIKTFKKMIAFVACLLVSTALACTPLNPAQNDTQMHNSVSMELDVNPIVKWTYSDGGKYGQPKTKPIAEKNGQNNIAFAIGAILADNKMDPNALDVDVIFTPKNCELVTACSSSTGSCVLIDSSDSVAEECTDNDDSIEVTTKMTVKLTAKIPVANSDWLRLSYKLREKLEMKGVNFNDDITLTY